MPGLLRLLSAALCATMLLAAPAARAELPENTAARSINYFGSALLARSVAAAPGETVLLSPFSAAMALAMAAQGARNETAEAFAEAFGTRAADLPAMAAAYARLAKWILADAGPNRLGGGQSLWVAQDVALEPAFAELLAERFGAPPRAVDFAAPATLELVNAWAAQHTEGLIPTLFHSLDPGTRVILASALAFAGEWDSGFDPERTAPAPFHRIGADGAGLDDPDTRGEAQDRPVPMMHRSAQDFLYAESEAGVQAVLLPYRGIDLALVLVLPPAKGSVADLLADPAALGSLFAFGRFDPRPGALAMPRLDLTFSADLASAFTETPLAQAFGTTADFSGMAEGPLQIDQVRHKTALQADEKGTRAAAATAVTMSRSYNRVPKPFTLTFDRPFLLGLTHIETGTLLFLGAVTDPGT